MIRYSLFIILLFPFAFLPLFPLFFFPASSSPRSPLDPLKGETQPAVAFTKSVCCLRIRYSLFMIRYSLFIILLFPFAFLPLFPLFFFPASSSPRSPLDPLKGETPARRSIYEVRLLSPVSRFPSPTSIFIILLFPFAFLPLFPLFFFPTSSSPRSPLDPLKGETPAHRSIY